MRVARQPEFNFHIEIKVEVKENRMDGPTDGQAWTESKHQSQV